MASWRLARQFGQIGATTPTLDRVTRGPHNTLLLRFKGVNMSALRLSNGADDGAGDGDELRRHEQPWRGFECGIEARRLSAGSWSVARRDQTAHHSPLPGGRRRAGTQEVIYKLAEAGRGCVAVVRLRAGLLVQSDRWPGHGRNVCQCSASRLSLKSPAPSATAGARPGSGAVRCWSSRATRSLPTTGGKRRPS